MREPPEPGEKRRGGAWQERLIRGSGCARLNQGLSPEPSPIAMNDKPKSPAPPTAKPAQRTPLPATNPRQTEDQRWQRTVRFNWDKGGSQGGRR